MLVVIALAVIIVVVIVLLYKRFTTERCCGNPENFAGNIEEALRQEYQKMFPDKMPHLIFHGTEWCGFCKKFKPQWELIKKRAHDLNLQIVLDYVDEEKNRTNGITGYPTITKFNNGVAAVWNGSRSDFDGMLKWAMS